MSAARALRVVYDHQVLPRLDDSLHAACIEEQARRAAYLKLVISEHQVELAELLRQYEQLADKFNDARAELAAWRAWMAQWSSYPALRKVQRHAQD